MPFPASLNTRDAGDRHDPFSWPSEDFAAVLAPVIAGARARGVADAMDLLGLGAVLIDRTGKVLHVSASGKRVMGGWMRIVEGHLVAERPVDNLAIQALVEASIGAERSVSEVGLASEDGLRTLAMRTLRLPADEGTAQALQAIIVLTEA